MLTDALFPSRCRTVKDRIAFAKAPCGLHGRSAVKVEIAGAIRPWRERNAVRESVCFRGTACRSNAAGYGLFGNPIDNSGRLDVRENRCLDRLGRRSHEAMAAARSGGIRGSGEDGTLRAPRSAHLALTGLSFLYLRDRRYGLQIRHSQFESGRGLFQFFARISFGEPASFVVVLHCWNLRFVTV